MEERGNKTIICSVFFLDIVEYSKKSVSEQISLKERFNAFLSIAIRDIPIEDRVILDTGDGAAVTFLGDVEAGLSAALSMRNSLLGEGGLVNNQLLVRMGINLGPVRLVRDINGQPNIVGDGINVAQRIMGFSDPGQILVSRSYYDAVSRVSEDYAGLFHYQGSRTDKHVREHEVYAIGYPGEMTGAYKKPGFAGMLSGWGRQLSGMGAGLKELAGLGSGRIKEWFDWGVQAFKNANAKQRAVYAAVVLLPLVLLAVFVAKMSLNSDKANKASLKEAGSKPTVVASAVVAASAAAKSDSAKPKEPAQKESPVKAPAQKEQKTEKTKAEKEIKSAKPEPASKVEGNKARSADAAGKATVTLTVKPWGEVYMDGKLQGISPPLSELQVPAGEHVITIKNTTFTAFKQKVDLKSGEKLTIKHSFN